MRLDEFSLFTLLLLLFKADPAVENLLDFRCEKHLLALNERFRLELSGFLRQREETLRDGYDILHLLDGVDALLDGFGML